jgi:hypothetical protein
MSVNSNDKISAADYNSLQSRIEQILGAGSDQEGYGQLVSSSQVDALTDPELVDGNSILVTHINNLRSDFALVFKHQTGEDLSIEQFQVGNIIGAENSANDISYAIDGSRELIDTNSQKGINDFFNLINTLEQNRLDIGPGEFEITAPLASDIRTAAWNISIETEFSVKFDSFDERRYFFNSGGEIKIEGIVTNASTQRGQFWSALVSNPGIINFGANGTSNTGSSVGVSFPEGTIGNYDLSTLGNQNYVTIFRKDASSGLYSDSSWLIQAKQVSSTEFHFRIYLENTGPESDFDAGSEGSISGGVTEDVQADIEFEIYAKRSNNFVVVDPPTASVVQPF